MDSSSSEQDDDSLGCSATVDGGLVFSLAGGVGTFGSSGFAASSLTSLSELLELDDELSFSAAASGSFCADFLSAGGATAGYSSFCIGAFSSFSDSALLSGPDFLTLYLPSDFFGDTFFSWLEDEDELLEELSLASFTSSGTSFFSACSLCILLICSIMESLC